MAKKNKKKTAKSKKLTLTYKELDLLVEKQAKKLAKKIVDKKVAKAVEKALAKASAPKKATPTKATPKKTTTRKVAPKKTTTAKAATPSKKVSTVGKISMNLNVRDANAKLRAMRSVASVNKFVAGETRATVLKVKDSKLNQLSKK